MVIGFEWMMTIANGMLVNVYFAFMFCQALFYLDFPVLNHLVFP